MDLDDDPSEELVSPTERLLEDDVAQIDDRECSNRSNYWSRKETYVWGTALFTLTTLTYSCRNCMPLSAVAMSTEFDWDKSETGLVLSSFFWGYVSTQILSGLLSDRIGGDQVITMATIVWGPLTLIYPFCAYAFLDKPSQLTFLVVNRIVFGMATAFHYPALSSICATRMAKENRSSLYAALDAGGSLAGILVSGGIGSYLLKRYGWRLIFYIFGATSTVWAIAMRVLLGKERCLHPFRRIKRPVDGRGLERGPSTKQVWALLIKQRGFWAMVFIAVANANASFLTLSWLPTFFEEQFPGAQGWVFNVLPWTLPVFSGFGSGWFADRLIKRGLSVTTTRKLIQTISSLSYATAYIFLGLAKCFSTALVIITYALTMHVFGTTGAYANPQDLAPTHAGSVYGVMNSFAAIPGFVGVYISGYILEYFDSWAAVFSLTSCISLLGWLVFILFGTGERLI